MKLKLPVYEFLIDETVESGVKCISIVGDPAFGSKAVFFEKHKPKYIALGDVKKQIIAGLSLIPNVLVYRIDPETQEEYNGYFSAETIEQIVNKFHDEQQGKNVNLEHNSNLPVNAYLLEDYIVNSPERVADLKAKGIEHPNIMGAWYVSYKIKDPKVFETIINSEIDSIGFSVESYLDKVLTDFNQEVINQIINKQIKVEMTKVNKSLKEKILAIFTEVENFQRALVPELAFDIEWGKVGEPVSKIITNENGIETSTPVGTGEFSTEKGIIVVDASSNLAEVRPLPAQPAEKAPEVPASGSTSGTTSGTTAVSGATAIVDAQPSAPAPSGVTDNTMPMIPSGTTSGDTNMAAYPWSQCISDQLAKGISQSGAEKICGWIKANNSSELSDAQLAELDEADRLACKKKKMDDEIPLASGSTSGTTATTDGLNKTIKELCPVAGDYIIQVCVDDTGTITEASVTSQKDLLPQAQDSGMDGGFSARVKKAFARLTELEAKMKEPISDPILAPEKKALTQDEFNKLTPFEKIKYNRGW
jgi:hypothetical protein